MPPAESPIHGSVAHRYPAFAVAMVVSLALCSALARAEGDPASHEDARAGGRLIWVDSEQLDLLGDLWVNLPFSLGPAEGFYFSLDTRLTIEKSTSDFAFQVRDLQYSADLGKRFRPGWLRGHDIFLFTGHTGKEPVDQDGRAYVRYAGVGFESGGFRRFEAEPGLRFRWRIAAAPVFEDGEVHADAVLRAGGRLTFGGWGPGPAVLEIDVDLDGLIDGTHLDAEIGGGPRLSLPAGPGRRASLFLHYVRGRNPLLLQEDLWMFGFAYEEGSGAGAWRPEPPEIDGTLTAGGGDGRGASRILLRMFSPTFAGENRIVFEVDANVLTADDTNELFYNYHAGIEHPLGNYLAGAYFFHRSNHQISSLGDEITAVNVAEVGLRSPNWTRPGLREGQGWTLPEFFARAGYLIESSFGEDRRWHARGGFRWSLPLRLARLQPFILAEGEAGDVERVTYALGAAVSPNAELRVEYRSDEQYFGRDQRAMLLSGTYGF